jgi:hypothetical protein
MQWIAPTEKDTSAATLENRLWEVADQFRANSGLNMRMSPDFAKQQKQKRSRPRAGRSIPAAMSVWRQGKR